MSLCSPFKQIILLSVNPRELDRLSVSFKLSGGLSLNQENKLSGRHKLPESCSLDPDYAMLPCPSIFCETQTTSVNIRSEWARPLTHYMPVALWPRLGPGHRASKTNEKLCEAYQSQGFFSSISCVSYCSCSEAGNSPVHSVSLWPWAFMHLVVEDASLGCILSVTYQCVGAVPDYSCLGVDLFLAMELITGFFSC